MMESYVLTFYCAKCKVRTRPFGDYPKSVPYSATVTCSECGYEARADWLDSDIHKKVLQNKYIKFENKDYDNSMKVLESKIKVLETGRDADRKEIQNLRQLIDLAIQRDIKELKESMSQQEYDKNFLQGQITKLNETFDKIRNWQKKQDG